MSYETHLPIAWNDKTLSWNAVCPGCKGCVFMLTEEAVHRGPRTSSGRSALLPVTMSARHACLVDPR